MSLQDELDSFRAEFLKKAPPGRAELYDAKVEELRRTFPVQHILREGSTAPDFTLPEASGAPYTLSEQLRDGPVVLIFYRGGWCPYCNIQLRAFQRSLDAIAGHGGQLAAISPQLPDGSLSTAETNQLGYAVLSDVGNKVARSFGLVYDLPQELRDALTANGKALPGLNGDESWELPLPSVYVIDTNRTVALATAELDYRNRLAPEAVIEVLAKLGHKAAKVA
jgi:peroxiredoxin